MWGAGNQGGSYFKNIIPVYYDTGIIERLRKAWEGHGRPK